jgi:hypothetical protein
MYGLLVGPKHDIENSGVLKISLLFGYKRFVGAGWCTNYE